MAKRKKTKESKKGFQYSNELVGLALILLSLTGLGAFGIVGEIVKKFAVFMFGSWFFVFLGFNLFVGIYMIAKRGKVNYLTGRLIGVYTIILVVLLFSHINYVSGNELQGKEILKTTLDNITTSFDVPSEIDNTGGGMVGACFSWIFVSLFDIEGSYVVLGALLIFGIIMIFDITLVDIGRAIASPFKKIFSREEYEDDDEVPSREKVKPSKVIEEDDEEESLPEKKVIITSVEDLPSHKELLVETKKEEEKIIEDNTPHRYVKPSIDLLDKNTSKVKANSTEKINENTKTLERVFKDFGMLGKVVEVHVGPAVTQYEMTFAKGTRLNKVVSISREIALALAAKDVRIQAPIPGKDRVGVEIPNENILPVSMREIMEAMKMEKKLESSPLAAPLGRDIMGNVKYVEINKTPHMLVAGATGSGKSVCINNIILSILMRTTPDEVKMVLVDPKKVEFSVYDGIPHLLTPVVTDPKKASAALQKIVVMMDDRFETFKNSGTKNIATYNEYVENKLKKDPNCGEKKMPFILVIIDELADLMLVAAKEVEESIMRITQLARAAGIHLIVATQRPSTDVITGVVKSNIPTRVSFAVSSSIDSRTILDMVGAEKLLGRGDMLYKPMDDNAPTRVQGSFVSDGEIARVVEFVKNNSSGARYDENFDKMTSSGSSGNSAGSTSGGEEKDVLYNEILDYAIRTGKISTSLIQRKFSIGFNRAARIIDQFESDGVVGPAKGSKPRDVLVSYGEKAEEE